MAEEWTTMQFPKYAAQIKQLAEDHEALKDEPLLLAINYDEPGAKNKIHILEIIENFGVEIDTPDQALFEVEFGSSNDFPLEPTDWLHLVLSNPKEFRTALTEGWPVIQVILDAITKQHYSVLVEKGEGKAILQELRDAAIRRVA